jgi:hypothetical protein
MNILRDAFGFPVVVNEKAVRVTAAGVALLAGATLWTGWLWLGVVLALGFALRVVGGPTLDPMSMFAAGVVAPRLGRPRPVSGTPKRFAQVVGLAFSTTAAVALALGAGGVAVAALGVLVLFASLEAALGFCAGCHVFALLMRAGLVSDDTCVECADITLRRREATPA